MSVAWITVSLLMQSAPLADTKPPSRDAITLAQALDLRPPLILRGWIDDPASIESSLLGVFYAARGPSCDPELAACKAAAREVAREVAPAKQAFLSQVSANYYARIFDSQMSTGEIRDAVRASATPTGRSLAKAFRSSATFTDEHARFLQLASQAVKYQGPDAVELFFQRTKALPRRAPLRAIPPPPPSPPPPN